jgi:hypothetical protein
MFMAGPFGPAFFFLAASLFRPLPTGENVRFRRFPLFARRIFGLLLLTLLGIVTPALTAGIDDIRKDFEPLSGYVIMPVQGEFLLDLDAGKGVAVGDLFSVLKPGEKIVHPVTKEVLGSLDEVKGLLQVTRVKSGYSYARPLGETKGVVKGDPVRRYENVSAALWDYTGQGEAFFAELKAALPALEWQAYAVAQAARPPAPTAPAKGGPQLLFILRHDGLEVRDGVGFQTIRAYPAPAAVSARPTGAIAAPPVAAAPLPVPAPTSLEGRLQALEQQLQGQAAAPQAPYQLDQPSGGIVYKTAFPGYQNLGNLPWVTTMSDFARDGDRLLLAATDGREIRIFTVGDSLVPLAQGDTSYVAEILAVRWWRPSPGDELRLAVSAWNDRRVESAIFALRGDRLVLLREHIPYLLGAFDRNGDGSPELLLGQNFDTNTFFGVQIKALNLVKGELTEANPGFPLPRRFTVQGSLFADVTGDGRMETIFVRDGLLYLYAGEKELYRSPKQMGGSLSTAIYQTNPNAREIVSDTVAFEVPPVAVDLDGDGHLELLTVASDRSAMGASSVGPGVKKSWLSVLKFRDGMFVKGTLGEELDVPLQGLTVQPKRALFVASEPANMLGQGGASHLLSFPLAQ